MWENLYTVLQKTWGKRYGEECREYERLCEQRGSYYIKMVTKGTRIPLIRKIYGIHKEEWWIAGFSTHSIYWNQEIYLETEKPTKWNVYKNIVLCYKPNKIL